MVSPKPRSTPIGGLATSEDAAVQRIRNANAEVFGAPPGGELWIGDDAAVVRYVAGDLLLATDAAVGGVHADLALVGLDDLGWKAVTATVSDIAAMGGRPLHALVALCVPRGTDVDRLAAGTTSAAAQWGCPVVGGDLSSARDVVAVVAVTGTVAPVGGAGSPDESATAGDPRSPERSGPQARPAVTRTGAGAGDHLFVTGVLGASAAGLRLLQSGAASGRAADPATDAGRLITAHRRPQARLAEGWAARLAGASAMIDVSDGLSIDLHRLADASNVGFRLGTVPVAAGATQDEALGGGEDYELVVATAEPEQLVSAFTTAGLRRPRWIGRCSGDPDERTLDGRALEVSGWRHALG